jgi:hypothetical protein
MAYFTAKSLHCKTKNTEKLHSFYGKISHGKNTSETKKKRGFLSRKLRFLSGAPAAVNHCLSGKRE